MRTLSLLILTTVLLSSSLKAQSADGKMTNEKMETLLSSLATEMDGQLGRWQILYKGRPLIIITDENANRMRIISPIIESKELKKKDLEAVLEANFDTALDAKYSVANELLWSSFTHPLRELTDRQFKDAVDQVWMLAATYGTSYQSTDLIFGGGSEE